MQSQDQKPKMLDQVRDVMRLHHYSIRTERTYLDWIKRYIAFHRMKSRDDLAEGEIKEVVGVRSLYSLPFSTNN